MLYYSNKGDKGNWGDGMRPPPGLNVSSGEDQERNDCANKYTATNTHYGGSTHDDQVTTETFCLGFYSNT